MTAGELTAGELDRVVDGLGGRRWGALSNEDLAQLIGVSRMTLHRRRVTRETVLGQIGRRLEEEHAAALMTALVSNADGAGRLRLALTGLCRVNERYLGLIEALGETTDAVFHEPRGGAVNTRPAFADGLVRILRDGAADGSLRVGDPEADATLIFNATGWTYRHMRIGHRWSATRCEKGVIGLLLHGVIVA